MKYAQFGPGMDLFFWWIKLMLMKVVAHYFVILPFPAGM